MERRINRSKRYSAWLCLERHTIFVFNKPTSVLFVDVMMQANGVRGRIKGEGVSVSGPISIVSVSVSTHSKLIKIKSYIKR